MRVDATTVRDLELFRTRDGGAGLFAMVDAARTPGGSRALRTRFEAPLADGDEIREVQDSLRFLVSEGIRFDLDPGLIREVARYLDSSWDTASGVGTLRLYAEALEVVVRYRDLLRDVHEGVERTRSLLASVRPFVESVLGARPPRGIRRPAEEILILADRVPLGRLPVDGPPWTTLKADHFLRVQRRVALARILELLYELDALCAMAEVVVERGWTLPELVEGGDFTLVGKGLVHPFVERAVPNPVAVSGGETLVFLTGPNMAGKTTYLKAVGMAVYLAHLGMGVPAARFRVSVLDALYSSLAPEESLRAGLSFFMAEVRRVREVAEAVTRGERALAIFDEVFRGTNVKDALEASRLVMLGFARSRTSGFVFSSHLTELARELEDEESIRFACFDGTIEQGRAHYEFRLREGVSERRLGLQLLEEERVPELLRSLPS